VARGRRVRLARVGGEVLAFEAVEGERRTARADGIVTAHHGPVVEVSTLPDRPPEASLVAVGCDPAFAVVAEAVRSARGVDVLWLQRGSRAALEALAHGEAHVAGVHLRDPATGEFNGPWIQRLVPFPCTVVRFAVWEQGILVGAGNPLGIRSVEDIARPTVRFLNREEGSGSRALLDESLASAGVPVGAVTGYRTGARSHMAVAEAIAAGLADAGVGVRAAAGAWGIDHLGLGQERYDLVVPDHFLDIPPVRSLLDVLRRPGLRAQVEALGGYDAAGIGEPL
jgi:putative molybdopterin biosynthesis protein